MSEYEVKATNPGQLIRLLDEAMPLGVVTERWDRLSVNFKPYDEQCTDEFIALAEEIGVEIKLV